MLPSFLASSNAGLSFASNENWLSPACLRLDAKLGGAVSKEKQNQIREIVLPGLATSRHYHRIPCVFLPEFPATEQPNPELDSTGIRERHEEGTSH